jgi:RNA polymerase sigma factor for flagellar operon FliA
MKTSVAIAPSANRTKIAKTNRAYQSHVEKVDETKLIEQFLPMVRSIVERVRISLPSHIEVDELYSVGVTGLIAAVRNYDAARGKTFAGYVSVRIRGAILDELRRLDWCPRRTRAKGRRLRDAIGELEQSLGREPTEKEIAESLDMSMGEYHKLLDEVRPVTFVALDDSGMSNSEGETGASLHETIPDHAAPNVREIMEKDELIRLVGERLDELPETQKKVLSLYYFEGLRLAEIAEVFGVTESRICQIHSQAILVLRSFVNRMRDR